MTITKHFKINLLTRQGLLKKKYEYEDKFSNKETLDTQLFIAESGVDNVTTTTTTTTHLKS